MVSDRVGDGAYIVAAAVCDAEASPAIRERMQELVLRPPARVHWHEEPDWRRDLLATVVAQLDVIRLVAVGTPMRGAKQERARRLCLTALLHRLGELGVSTVWLEARTATLNVRDAELVRLLRGRRVIPATLRVETARPVQEPMLWVADIVAGAVQAAETGQGRWRHRIGHIEDLRIDL